MAPSPSFTQASPSIIFQSAKLGDVELITKELDWAQSLLDKGETPSRVYGISGGALPALAYALSLSARYDQAKLGKSRRFSLDLRCFSSKSAIWTDSLAEPRPALGHLQFKAFARLD